MNAAKDTRNVISPKDLKTPVKKPNLASFSRSLQILRRMPSTSSATSKPTRRICLIR